jgi:hypothetical protein
MLPTVGPAIGIRGRRCAVCGTPLKGRDSRWKQICDGWKCRLQFQRMTLRSRRKHDELYLQRYRHRLDQAAAFRNASAKALGIPKPESYRVIVTPANLRPIAPLPRRRRYRFLKRLKPWAESALSDGANPTRLGQNNSTPLSIMDIACANCGGICCLRGGTGAHLSRDTIHLFAIRSAITHSREILEAYSRRLPEKIYQGSCVFHSAEGCRLPRSMRSAPCLNFNCGGIVELRLRMGLDGETKFFLAAINKDGVARGRFETLEFEGLPGQ